MSNHPLYDDDNDRSSIQSQTQVCNHHTTLSFTLVHFTCEGTKKNNGRFNTNTCNCNIQTNDTDAAFAPATSEPLPILPTIRSSNNKSIPSTIHEWFQYIESAYRCIKNVGILKAIGHNIRRNNNDQNDIQINAQTPLASSIPPIQSPPSSLSIGEQT